MSQDLPKIDNYIDQSNLNNFCNRYFQEKILEFNIPGAVFSLVKDGSLLLNKGYGLANIESQIPVFPEQTVFRVASVSKLVTATAIMQLVEKKKLNLEDDVNQYLEDFHLDNNYAQPVKIAHLLTHTGGFDDRFIGLESNTPLKLSSMKNHLATRMPHRVMPPGEVISYSNYGMGLAGYLVEVVSQLPFAEYVRQNILQPLGMKHSSFELSSHLMSALATGYEEMNDTLVAVPYSYIKLPPGGAFITTATDIARLAIAHLQGGCYGNTRILEPETVELMHQQQFTHDPRLSGFAYGFYERIENNRRAIVHEGIMRGFSSLLWLLPEENLGLFIACNREELKLADEFVSEFLDYFYPVLNGTSSPTESSDHSLALDNFTGYYRHNRYSRTTLQKLVTLFSQLPVNIQDNQLCIPEWRDPEKVNLWQQVEPLLFCQHCDSSSQDGSAMQNDGEDYLAFKTNLQGQVTHMFRGINAWEKLPWYATRPFHFSLVVFCVLVFLIGTVASFLPGFDFTISSGESIAKILFTLVSWLNLAFIVGFALVSSDRNGLAYGVPLKLILLLCIPLITCLIAIALFSITLTAWFYGYWSWLERLVYSLTTTASLIFVWFLWYWNLLGFRF